MRGLSILKGQYKTYNIHSFDIETEGQKNTFLLGGYYNGKRYKSFYKDIQETKGSIGKYYQEHTKEQEMMRYITKQSGKNTYCFATNLGFDFNALYFNTKEFDKFDKLLRSGSYILCRNEDILMSDTMNFTPSSVEKLGKLLKLKKLHHPKFLGTRPKDKKELIYLKDYNSVDCKITAKFMEELQKVINSLGGQLKITIASTALDLYRRKFMPCDIHKEPKYEDMRDLIFESYYGGRTEVFNRGIIPKNKYKVYDYNSLYPSVMLNKYPKPDSAIHVKNKKLLTEDIFIDEGVSHVKVECPYMKYPLLPYRYKGKLLFPYGRFEGIYTHAEIRKALEIGYKIIEIKESIIYTKTFYPFKEWVETLYNLRLKYQKEGNEIFATIIKLLMNSLYGKFGSRWIDKFEFINLRDDATTMEMVKDSININEDYTYKSNTLEIDYNYCIPILASYTTAYARLKLYEGIIKTNPVYIDTDSLFTDVEIKDSKLLGELKLEKKIKEGYIIKPKVYYINDSNTDYIRVKGFRKMTIKDFYKILDNKKVTQKKFMKIKEAIRRGFQPNEIVEFEKEMTLEDDKRVWKGKYNITEFIDSKPIHINQF